MAACRRGRRRRHSARIATPRSKTVIWC